MRDAKFSWVGDEFLAGPLDSRADGDRHVRAQAEPEVVRLSWGERCERRTLQRDDDFGGRHGEGFSGADEKWYAFPTPRIDIQPHCGKRLDRGVRRNAFFLAVTPELPPDERVRR